jgi:hypothetical protein
MNVNRGTSRFAAPAICLILLMAVTLCAAGKSVPLFHIERSKNANIVKYDALLTPGGSLDPKKPVDVYWVLLAEKGQREALNWIQKKKAYGFDIEPAKDGKGFMMMLKPMRERPIRVFMEGDAVHAGLTIGGKSGYLEKLFINSEEGSMMPKVIYIELFGKDAATGEALYEKILPKD